MRRLAASANRAFHRWRQRWPTPSMQPLAYAFANSRSGRPRSCSNRRPCGYSSFERGEPPREACCRTPSCRATLSAARARTSQAVKVRSTCERNRKKMSRSKLWSLAVVPMFVLLAGANPPAAQAQHPEAAKGTAKPESASDDKVAHGRYIVENVAMCSRCHSPLDHNGERDTTHWLQGGAIGFTSTVPVTDWAMVAPRIGGR